MYGCESWTVKKAECQRIDAFELWCWRRLLRVPDYKEIQPIYSKGEQSWDFFGRNDAKAETPVFCPPHAKSWLIRKDSDAGGDWGQEEKGTTEDEMAGWHHRLSAHELGWTLGVGDGQGGLACCDSWGCKESDATEWLNWTEYIQDVSPRVLRIYKILQFSNARPFFKGSLGVLLMVGTHHGKLHALTLGWIITLIS